MHAGGTSLVLTTTRPDNCDGTYQANCDPNRAYTNITQILQSYGANDLLNYMQTYWTDYQGNDESFWDHEWAKHGTCISTFNTNCYNNYTPQEEVVDFFNSTTKLYATLNSYQFLASAGITPSSSQNYSSQAVLNALGNGAGYTPYISCSNGALNEIWYYFYLTGSVQTGTFQGTNAPGNNNNCPASLQYLPKTSSSSSSSTKTTATATKTTSTATSTASSSGAFIGKGYMNVNTSGSQNGCIISAGTWYTSGTCATFTGTSSGSGVTLSSSKGNCAIVSGVLSCASSVSSPTVFGVQGGMLAYGGSTTFYASSVPSGSTQAKVEVAQDNASLQIVWQGM